MKNATSEANKMSLVKIRTTPVPMMIARIIFNPGQITSIKLMKPKFSSQPWRQKKITSKKRKKGIFFRMLILSGQRFIF
jgi:hypothetical protein